MVFVRLPLAWLKKLTQRFPLDGFKGLMCRWHIIGLIPDVPLEVITRKRHRKASELNPSNISCQAVHVHPARGKTLRYYRDRLELFCPGRIHINAFRRNFYGAGEGITMNVNKLIKSKFWYKKQIFITFEITWIQAIVSIIFTSLFVFAF